MILQVDRVASVEEALALRGAGVTHLGLEIGRDPRFEDGRHLTPETAAAIRAAVPGTRIVALLEGCTHDPDGGFERLNAVRAFRPDLLQVWRGDLDHDLEHAVAASGVPLIGDGVTLDSDHGAFLDPDNPAAFLGWPDGALRPTLLHVDVVPDREDPWAFLTGEARDYPDDSPQLADIQAATRALPLLLSLMGLSPETAPPYARAFPDAGGFFARLGPDDHGLSTASPEGLLQVLRALRTPASIPG